MSTKTLRVVIKGIQNPENLPLKHSCTNRQSKNANRKDLLLKIVSGDVKGWQGLPPASVCQLVPHQHRKSLASSTELCVGRPVELCCRGLQVGLGLQDGQQLCHGDLGRSKGDMSPEPWVLLGLREVAWLRNK